MCSTLKFSERSVTMVFTKDLHTLMLIDLDFHLTPDEEGDPISCWLISQFETCWLWQPPFLLLSSKDSSLVDPPLPEEPFLSPCVGLVSNYTFMANSSLQLYHFDTWQ